MALVVGTGRLGLPVSTRDVLGFALTKVGIERAPGVLYFGVEIPRNAVGKVVRPAARNMLGQARDAASGDMGRRP